LKVTVSNDTMVQIYLYCLTALNLVSVVLMKIIIITIITIIEIVATRRHFKAEIH